MAHGQTTSIRLPPELRDQLESTSHRLKRSKNWIIVHALEEYLPKINNQRLVEEARRQLIIASKYDSNESWEQDTDTSGWI